MDSPRPYDRNRHGHRGSATGSTYTVTSADEGKALKVRVNFTDDAGNEESVTSYAVIASPPLVSRDQDEQDEGQTVQLTATIHDAPDSHNGRGKFTFELRFSETVPISFKTLRDHAFTVTGGKVVKAKRLEKGGNVRWEIHVRPTGDATVTIALPATTDCDTAGAICTADGRMLSVGLELSVPGPGG